MVITVTYNCKYRLSFATNYVFTKCGQCYNLKSGRFIKQIYKNGMIGYMINRKFYSLKRLKSFLERMPNRQMRTLEKLTN
jgi:hypothetical protein